MEVKKGYKQTEVGIIPKEWEVVKIGDLYPFVTSGSRGWAAYYSDRGTPFIRITNLSRKSIYLNTDDLKYVNLPPEAREGIRTQLQTNDVLISITADIGVIGYITQDLPQPAYINQHIALVRFDPTKADSKFVSYFLASENPQKLFLSMTDLGAKAGMSLITVQKIPLALPSLPEQRIIAAALSDVDALLAALDAVIAKKHLIKQGAMQELLTGKKRLPGFSGEWSPKRLGDVLDFERPDRCIVNDTKYLEAGTPVLTANKSFVLGYIDENFGIYIDLPVIIFDDFTTDSKYVDFPFKVKSSAIKILLPKNKRASLRFIFERMQLISFSLGNHKRYYISEYQHIQIPMPEENEQHAIAAVLTDMDAEIAALKAQRKKIHLLKQGMMQELLTGRIRLV